MKIVIMMLLGMLFVGCTPRGVLERDIRNKFGEDVNINKNATGLFFVYYVQKPNGEVWICDYTWFGNGTYKMFPAVK